MKRWEAEGFPVIMDILGEKLKKKKNNRPPVGVKRILKTPKLPSLLALQT